MILLVVRAFVYLLLVLLLAEVMRWELTAPYIERPYSEAGLVELLQSLMLLAMLTMAVVSARSNAEFRQLGVCMALAISLLLIRENDHPLDFLLFHGSWKYFALVPMAAGAVYFWKHRAEVTSQVWDYSKTASFGMLLAGILVLAYSRLLGRSAYWKAVMGDSYQRIVKNAVEEGVELVALFIMLVAIVEFFILCRRPELRE